MSPEIPIWARETAGLDRDNVARKINLNGARGVSGADRLAAIEAGDEAPSASILQRMAQQYRRPLLTFYMSEVPEPPDVGQDFRTLPAEGDPSNVRLATLLRDVQARQSLVRDTLGLVNLCLVERLVHATLLLVLLPLCTARAQKNEIGGIFAGDRLFDQRDAVVIGRGRALLGAFDFQQEHRVPLSIIVLRLGVPKRSISAAK